ncbi:FUSC family protein [Curtobacterium sp. MCPF17_001]|uniref:FUSC family protein n=1 Tax=Curtobacterium sp. MCPF17_001 TaxID=2175651 RepID=UPI000DA87CB9|nr:FUSC family protein [Curtobacterium sp. MCPF17_001]PZE57640.1 FUSC family protein [Curtobacterium sp. MCPF17_001]
MQFQHIAGVGTRVWRWSRSSGTQPRLLHAGKAAAAGALAWTVARHVPGVASDYPYYAPLGAVVAMQTTVFAGLRSGVQTLVGIALGIAVAAFTMWVGEPGVLAVALAVGVGVLVGGFRILGEGSSWVSTAALFVLLVGGAHAEGYSLGYLVQMAVGVVVGLLVNFLVFPPLRFWDAERRIDQVNSVLAEHLDGLADVLEQGQRDERAWDRAQDRLDRAIADVRSRVSIAQESRRINPRGALRGSRARLQRDGSRFRALERVAWYTTDLTELVARSGPVSSNLGRPDEAFTVPLTTAVRQVAAMIRGDHPPEEGDRAISELERALDASREYPSDVAVTSSALVSLRGIVESERQATQDLDTATGPSDDTDRRPIRERVRDRVGRRPRTGRPQRPRER